MPLSATINTTAKPMTMTVVAAPGERTTTVIKWPLSVTDDSGHVWTVQSDDGVTAELVY